MMYIEMFLYPSIQNSEEFLIMSQDVVSAGSSGGTMVAFLVNFTPSLFQ